MAENTAAVAAGIAAAVAAGIAAAVAAGIAAAVAVVAAAAPVRDGGVVVPARWVAARAVHP